MLRTFQVERAMAIRHIGLVAAVIVGGQAGAVTVTVGGVDAGFNQGIRPPVPCGADININCSTETRFDFGDPFSRPRFVNLTPATLTVADDTVIGIRRQPSGLNLNDGAKYLALGGTEGLLALRSSNFNLGGGAFVDSIGFLWGSVDRYNSVEFLNEDFELLSMSFFGLNFGTALDGFEAAVRLAGLDPDDLLSPAAIPELYVNFFFSQAEAVRYIRVRQTNNAFEFGNIAIQQRVNGTTPTPPPLISVDPLALAVPAAVPEPAALLLFGLGALAAAALRRR